MEDTKAAPASVEPIESEARPEQKEAPSFNAAYDREALLNNLPEGYDKDKFSKYLDKTADPFVAYKNYSNLEKMKSKGLPNEAWEDSDWENLYSAMGVPKDADGYKFGEDIGLDEDSQKFIKSFASEAKMTPQQAEKAAKLMQQVRQAEEVQKQEQKAQAVNNMIEYLTSEWGHQDSESYANNFKLVSGVLESMGIKHGSDVSNAIWSGPPQIIKIVKEYADMLDPAVIKDMGVGDTATPKSTTEQMNQIISRMTQVGRESGFNSKEYLELDAKYNRLYQQRERMG